MYVQDTGGSSIYVPLPNNPEDRSVAELSYHEPQVHALHYMGCELVELVKFARQVVDHLLDEHRPTSIVPAFGIRAQLPIGAGGAQYLVPPEVAEVDESIREALAGDSEPNDAAT